MPFLSLVQNNVPQIHYFKLEITFSANIYVKSSLHNFSVGAQNPQFSIRVYGKIQQQAIYVPQDYHLKVEITFSAGYLRQIVSKQLFH